MKIGCISWSYKSEFTSEKWNIGSWMQHCKNDLLLDGVELWNRHVGSTESSHIRSVKAMSDQLRLPIYSVASKLELGSFSGQSLAAAEETFAEWVSVAKGLGCETLRFSIGGEELRKDQNREKVFSLLRRCLDAHRDNLKGLRVGIENQQPGLVESIEDVKELRMVLGGRTYLVLDNGSFRDREVTYDFTRHTLQDACLVHVKFYGFDPQKGDTSINYLRYLPLLSASGYKGFLSIEFDSEEVPSVIVPKIAKYLREQLGTVVRAQ